MSINFKNISSQKNIFLITLLGCTALGYPTNLIAGNLSAKTSWAVSRVASASQGSYCTMAQKYSDETILTLARNKSDEYSLAFDFKDAQFKGGTQKDVTLSVQGGGSQKFNLKPNSERTMVVNLGKNMPLINQLAATESLSVDMNGQTFNFVMKDFKAGQSEMNECIGGITSSEKSTPETAVNTKLTTNDEPTAEGLLAAMPMPSNDIKPAISAKKEAQFVAKMDAPSVVSAPSVPVMMPTVAPSTLQKDNQELSTLKEENAKLTRAISEQRQAFENNQSNKESAILAELREKLYTIKSENESLKKSLAETQPKEDSSKIKADMSTLAQSVKTLQDENLSLKAELVSQKAIATKAQDTAKQELAKSVPAEDVSKLKSDMSTLAQSVKTLQDENQSLKVQLANQKATSGKTETLVNQAQRDAAELAAVKSENETLKNQMKIASSAKAETSPIDDKELLRVQLENKDLKQQIEQLRLAAKVSVDTEPKAVSDDDSKLRNEINSLTSQLNVLGTENNALKTQIANLQNNVESSQLKAAGGNWDLEQSTRRYQESQREIVRLGALLQTQEAKCTNEKKDIESMLFDPEIAAKAQIAMVNSLQDQIKEKDEKLKLLEGHPMPLATPEKDKEIAQLKENLFQTENELAQKNQQLADMNAKPQATQAPIQIATSDMPDVPLDNKKNGEIAKQIQSKPAVENQATITASQETNSPDFKSIDEVSALLKGAGVIVRGALQTVPGSGAPTYRAYSWKTDSLYGSAEMNKVSDASQLDSVINQYLARAKKRCGGEFAAVPSPVKSSHTDNIKAYEIACVGGSSSSSASVLFSYGDQIVTTIAHEGRAEAMDMAIDARDKVASRL